MRRLLPFVAVALVLDTCTYAAITPLLPGLSEKHSLDKGEAGVLSGAYAAGTFALSLPSAWVVARAGARATVLGGLLGLAAASLSFGLAGTAPLLVAARFVQGAAAAAIWTGALAWIVAVAPRERRAEAIGTAVGAAIAGSLGGPALGAAADELGTGVVFGAFVALPLALVAWGARMPGAAAVQVLTLRATNAMVRSRRALAGMWLMALPALGFGAINVLVPLRLDDLGAGATAIGATFLAAVALEAAISPLAGRVSDRHGTLWTARIGVAAGGVALVLLPLPSTAVLAALGVVVAAPLLGMLWAPALTLLSEVAEGFGLDSAFGFALANLAWGAGATVGAAGGGNLAEATADAVPYALLGALALGTAALLSRRLAPAPRVVPGEA